MEALLYEPVTRIFVHKFIMRESILHFVWQFRLFPLHGLKTTDGEPIEVIDTGRLNTDAGPDFFNAKLRIGGTIWAGNVEIHNRSSDWLKHHHDTDKAYAGVILHVVNKADRTILRGNGGEVIPQLELTVPKSISDNYRELFSQKNRWIRCEDNLSAVPAILMSGWKNALLVERLERKSTDIKLLLEQSNNHWEEAFYIQLAKNFGFGTNSLAFEMTAKSLSINILSKHKDNLFQLEALLFGQSGLLDEGGVEAVRNYRTDLQQEYRFLRNKYQLESIDASQWKLLRLRPNNFPHVRLAQFAALIHRSAKLFSKIIDAKNVETVRMLFDVEVSDYWKRHYLFDRESPSSDKQLGVTSIDLLIINTVVPFLFTYSKEKGEPAEDALKWLEEMAPEKNAVIRKWSELGVVCQNAFDSQALIQLKKEYCDLKKCLACRIGHKVLTT